MDLSESAKVTGNLVLYAPWRSLIYRVVDTPFPYTDDNALFPHMPMNTAGYDCSAKQIMSDWMVSIPATRKFPQLPEYDSTSTSPDDTPQPYVEALPGSVGYDQAASEAQKRLSILHTGTNPLASKGAVFSQYASCPDTSDIVDPAVERDPTCHPVPTPGMESVNGNTGTLSDVPGHAHWVITDLTQVAGTYSPRRADWATYLVEQKFPSPEVSCTSGSLQAAQQDQDEVKLTVNLLQTTTIDQIREFATQSLPMGLWQVQPGCDLASQPTVASYTGSARPRWMDNPASHASPNSPVYAEPPGAAVFGMICQNCHGPLADAHGRLADNLLLMTGGVASVADLRDGLFGPVADPGANRQGPFGTLTGGIDAGAWQTLSVDDRAARYLVWMASGGTEVSIPEPILQIVGATQIFGVPRSLPAWTVNGNMLSVAKALCESLLFSDQDPAYIPLTNQGGPDLQIDHDWFTVDGATGTHLLNDPDLITSNGDAELWLKLCSVNNPPPIRALHGNTGGAYLNGIAIEVDSRGRLFSLDLYPSDDPTFYGANPVGNDRGTIDADGIASDNLRPWCYRASSSDENQQPHCPPSIDDGKGGISEGIGTDVSALQGLAPLCTNRCWGPDAADAWATRGAINAGIAVYLYLDGVAKGTLTRLPDYTDCKALP